VLTQQQILRWRQLHGAPLSCIWRPLGECSGHTALLQVERGRWEAAARPLGLQLQVVEWVSTTGSRDSLEASPDVELHTCRVWWQLRRGAQGLGARAALGQGCACAHPDLLSRIARLVYVTRRLQRCQLQGRARVPVRWACNAHTRSFPTRAETVTATQDDQLANKLQHMQCADPVQFRAHCVVHCVITSAESSDLAHLVPVIDCRAHLQCSAIIGYDRVTCCLRL
jgi:hypothetical protein